MSLIETPAKLVSGSASSLGAPVGSLTNALRNPFSRSTNKEGLERTNDYKDGFIIEEILDGPRDNIKIVLTGNMMPFQGLERAVTIRKQKEFYPGSDEPTIHVLGYEEDDVTIKGRFYSKKYSKPEFREVANEMREALEEMAKRKPLVKITLGEWVRYCVLEKVKTSEKTKADIDYEITFSLFGVNRPRNYQLVDQVNDVPIEVNTALIALASEFQKNYSSAPDYVPASIGDILNDLTSSVAQVLGVVTGFVDALISTGEDVTASLSRAVGLIRYAKNTLIQYRRRVGAISYSLGINGVNVPKRYRTSAYMGNSISDTLSIQELLNQLLKRFQQLSRTVPLHRHLVRIGDTLQKLSTRYYGVPDNWKKIYDHNKLTSTDLTRGVVLEIPKL